MTTKFTSIDEYIAEHSPEVQEILQRIRSTIKEAVPEAVETIAYNMPTFAVDKKSIVHFAAWKTHIGMYPIPPGDMEFAAAIDPYRTEKGTAIPLRHTAAVPPHCGPGTLPGCICPRPVGASS